METKWKPILLTAVRAGCPTGQVQPKCRFASHTMPQTLGKSQDKASVSDFAKSCIPGISPSPPPKKNFPLPPLGDICSMARYIVQWSWTSWDTCHPALSLVHPQDITSPSNFQVLQVSNCSKTNGKEDHLRVPPWFLLRVQRIQRWDLSMDEGFADLQVSRWFKKTGYPQPPPKFQCQVAMNFFHFPRSINASR